MIHIYHPNGYNFYDQAQLRAYLGDFDAAMIAAGLERTADTGQLDVATVVPATNIASGWFVHLFAPMLYKWPGVGNYPDLYLRVRFSVGNIFVSNTGHVPAAAVTVGTGTTGSAELTGVVLTAQDAEPAFQNGYRFMSDERDGYVASGDSFLSVCINPGRQSSETMHRWGVPFFCIEREENGDYHCTRLRLPGDLRSAPTPDTTPAITVESCLNGVKSELSPACAFLGVPAGSGSAINYQPFFRGARSGFALFSPLVAVSASTPLGSSFEVEGQTGSSIYMSCGTDVGNRVSICTPNMWVPAIKTQ